MSNVSRRRLLLLLLLGAVVHPLQEQQHLHVHRLREEIHSHGSHRTEGGAVNPVGGRPTQAGGEEYAHVKARELQVSLRRLKLLLLLLEIHPPSGRR